MIKKHRTTRLVNSLRRNRLSDLAITRSVSVPPNLIPWYYKHMKRVRHYINVTKKKDREELANVQWLKNKLVVRLNSTTQAQLNSLIEEID